MATIWEDTVLVLAAARRDLGEEILIDGKNVRGLVVSPPSDQGDGMPGGRYNKLSARVIIPLDEIVSAGLDDPAADSTKVTVRDIEMIVRRREKKYAGWALDVEEP